MRSRIDTDLPHQPSPTVLTSSTIDLMVTVHRLVVDQEWEGFVDVGSGKRLLVPKDVERNGAYLFEHECRRDYLADDETVVCAPRIVNHTIVSTDPVTITPSILCVSCGTHGYVTDGAWTDC